MDFQFYRSSDHWFQELSSKRKTLWSRVLCALQIEASTETLEPNKKKSDTLFWMREMSGGRVFLRGVGSTASRADIGISDECDSVDDFLPRALKPRVFARAGHCDCD